jgi:hypothetical protein
MREILTTFLQLSDSFSGFAEYGEDEGWKAGSEPRPGDPVSSDERG